MRMEKHRGTSYFAGLTGCVAKKAGGERFNVVKCFFLAGCGPGMIIAISTIKIKSNFT